MSTWSTEDAEGGKVLGDTTTVDTSVQTRKGHNRERTPDKNYG